MAEIVDGKIKLSIRATEIENAVAQTTTNTTQIEALTTSIGNKVDKVVGKSLVDNTEIERLASVENYDDTIVLDKIELVQTDVTTLNEAVENKVDKVVGKSLVDDIEIERLASVENYDDTTIVNKIELVQTDVTTLNEAVFEEESTITDNSCIIEVTDASVTVTATFDNGSTTSVSLSEDGKGIIELGSHTTLDLNTQGIKSITINNATTLNKLIAYGNNLVELRVNGSENLQYIHIHNNPICSDKNALILLANDLVDRNGKAFGSIIIGDTTDDANNTTIQTLRREIEIYFIGKDWYFGSTLLYTDSSLRYYIKNSGVVDIWESAEYGEGTTVAIADIGFSKLNCVDSTTRWKYPLNASSQAGTDSNPLPLPTNTLGYLNTATLNHGNLAQTCVGGSLTSTTGKGIAPKCSIIPIKLGDAKAGYFYSNELVKMMTHVLNHQDEIDTLVMSTSVSWFNERLANNNFYKLKELSKKFMYDTEITFCAADKNSTNANSDFSKEVYTAEFPMFLEGAICCGAAQSNNEILNTTCPNSALQLVFYGKDITYEISTHGTSKASGCSPANFLLGGCAALMTNLLTKKFGRKPTREEKEKYLLERTIPYSNLVMKQAGNGLFNFMAYNDNVQPPDSYGIYLEREGN